MGKRRGWKTSKSASAAWFNVVVFVCNKCLPKARADYLLCTFLLTLGSLEVGILAAFLAVSLLINILIVVFIAVWKLRTNKQNNVKNEDAPVYYNADALEMVSSSSTMNQQISSNPGQEYQERRESTGNSNQNQDHYQQLNPDTLQSNTDAAPTYETLNGVRIGERNDQHTYQSLLNQPRFYQSLQSYANVDTA
ncbi:hypothetical protein AC249_AIPGENE5081 [Exaiptasia diaphana]|nr:hypothetical protein AC249_AIPGENE5081 [Exaiptasia diaphana]